MNNKALIKRIAKAYKILQAASIAYPNELARLDDAEGQPVEIAMEALEAAISGLEALDELDAEVEQN